MRRGPQRLDEQCELGHSTEVARMSGVESQGGQSMKDVTQFPKHLQVQEYPT